MITLSKGYLLPETGDFGNEWFPAMEFNIQRINSHKHDGLDSEKLSSSSITAQVIVVLAASFTLLSPGLWRAAMTLPSSMLVDDTVLVPRDPVTSEIIYLKTEKKSISEYYLYTNFVQDFNVSVLT